MTEQTQAVETSSPSTGTQIIRMISGVLGHFVVKRFLFFLFVVWLASTVIFIIPRLSGQDPVKEKLLLEAQRGGAMQTGLDAMAKSYQKRFGLDQPMWTQYVNFLKDLSRLDLGFSIAFFPRTVNDIVFESLMWTLGLMGTVTILAFILGTLAGAVLGWPRKPGWLQYIFMPLLTLSAIPQYLLAMILIFVVAFQLGWLPLFGGYAPATVPTLTFEFAVDVVRHAILPAFAIIFSAIGFWAIGMRGMMINTQGEDYMIQADAKGLKGSRIFMRYAVRNALLPQVTGLALVLGTIVTGQVLVERVFSYPGIGDILFQAIRLSDFFVIRGIVIIIILGIAGATFLLDVLYPLLDPRIKVRNS
ncbi:MAG: ABC transporter permease [Chloroflexi bacterium]|nr:ABC transporter permease [Chloroflexota bacterium]MDA1281621.1 ABC transporter permease [Chloroflexota bacterium]